MSVIFAGYQISISDRLMIPLNELIKTLEVYHGTQDITATLEPLGSTLHPIWVACQVSTVPKNTFFYDERKLIG